jgi:hypothetical protein
MAAEGASGRSRAQDCRETMLDIHLGRRPRRHADAHRSVALPNCGTAPTRTFRLNATDYLTGALGASKGYQDLVQHDLI